MTDVELRRVEHHMSTAVTLGGTGIDEQDADRFFDRVAELEGLLSRFRPDSQISRIARGELAVDDADPVVQQVLVRCEVLREQTHGAFDHEPRSASGDPGDPVLDPNAIAKGWIIDDAAAPLRRAGAAMFVNAGGDVVATPRTDGRPWHVGIQHPTERHAILGTFEIVRGAVATSGCYERGDHIRSSSPRRLVSVTVVGPDLATADGLSTAVFASGRSAPDWWGDVPETYGLLTLDDADRLRWIAPVEDTGITWRFPARPSQQPSG
jgi:thiamine biosynthesis lipoprotein